MKETKLWKEFTLCSGDCGVRLLLKMRVRGVCWFWWALPVERLLRGSDRVLALPSLLSGRLRWGAQLVRKRKGMVRGGDLGPLTGLDRA